MHRDLDRATRPGESHHGPLVRPDHGRVDVAVAIDLGATQKTDLDPAVLQKQLKHIRHAAHHERTGDQRRVADRHRQARGASPHGARLVDEDEVGRVRRARQVTGEIR